MKKKKRGLTPSGLILLIVLVICIVSIIIVIIKSVGNKSDKNADNNLNKGTDIGEGIENINDNFVVDIEGEENVKVNSDGRKENTNSNLKREHDVSGYKISNAQITYLNGISTITADIKNNTGSDVEEVGIINIKVKDSDGEVVREMSTYIMGIKNGETKQINASITSEIVNASDLEFSI